MGLRFRKRAKIAPGLTLNFSWSAKKGITTSSTVGVPGANVNVGTKKDGSLGIKRGTLGIPGSGLSHHENLDDSVSKKDTSKRSANSDGIESSQHGEGAHEDGMYSSDEVAEKELVEDNESQSTIHYFAYNRTINWIINLAILGGLFYLNS